jgi:hypothetical protein
MQDRKSTPTAHEEALEYAAQALRDVVGNRSGRGRAWPDLPESLRNEYRAEARAAVQAYLLARETAP